MHNNVHIKIITVKHPPVLLFLQVWASENAFIKHLHKKNKCNFKYTSEFDHIPLVLRGCEHRVNKIQFLGVITDDKVCCKSHIKHNQNIWNGHLCVCKKSCICFSEFVGMHFTCIICFLIYLPLVNGSHLTKRGQWNNLVKLMISNNFTCIGLIPTPVTAVLLQNTIEYLLVLLEFSHLQWFRLDH